jgi:ribosomal protein S18 acetylase RimI-like enzyme
MMKTHRIVEHRDPFYPHFIRLYESAFPLHEQRTPQQHLTALRHGRYHLNCFIEQETLVGFVCYWEFADYLYIEHYAINDSARGKGYGSLLLKDLLTNTDKRVILEIDPLVDAIAEKRLHFYQKLGFVQNDYPHSHPPYQDGYKPHQLLVLSDGQPISECAYRQFKHDLDDIVMFSL